MIKEAKAFAILQGNLKQNKYSATDLINAIECERKAFNILYALELKEGDNGIANDPNRKFYLKGGTRYGIDFALSRELVQNLLDKVEHKELRKQLTTLIIILSNC